MTKIEWTEQTWNPIVGCSKVSPGCVNCYAERMAWRLAGMGQARYARTTIEGRGKGTGHFNSNALDIPLKRRHRVLKCLPKSKVYKCDNKGQGDLWVDGADMA